MNQFIDYLSEIEFFWPWVWLILPGPLLLYFFFPAYKEYSESVRVPNLSRIVTDSFDDSHDNGTNHKWPYFLLTLIWLCIVAVAARPEHVTMGRQEEVAVRDMLLVLDISGSMAIRDMKDENGEVVDRMQIMKKAMAEFIQKRTHDNIGLIGFGTQALPLTPLSRDHQALLEQIDEMVPGMAGPQTSIGDAIGVAIKTYSRMDKGLKDKRREKERMMILLTDGLDTSSVLPPSVALRLAQKQNIIIHTIAFGDTKESSGSIDLNLLKEIADKTEGSFHEASESLSSLQEVYSSIDKLTPRKVELVGWSVKKSLSAYPLAVALLLSIALFIPSMILWRKHD